MGDRLPPSNIQQLCTGDAEFMVGEIYGLRQWSLRSFGRLYGHFGHVWPLSTEPLVASCQARDVSTRLTKIVHKSIPPDFVLRELYEHAHWRLKRDPTYSVADPDTARLVFSVGVQKEETIPLERLGYLLEGGYDGTWFPGPPIRSHPTVDHDLWEASLVADRADHNIGHPACTCGFYAYTDWDSLYQNSLIATEDYVFGLVRGYGHVTVGTNGFRAEKADIVALTHSHEYDRSRLSYTDQNPARPQTAQYGSATDSYRYLPLVDVMAVHNGSYHAHWRHLVKEAGIELVPSFTELQNFIEASGLQLGLT